MRTLLFAAVALCLLCSALAQVNIPYTNCGGPNDEVTINSATANVFPPVPGQTFSVSIEGVLHNSISDGEYEAQVSFDGIPIIDKKGDIKELLSNYSWPVPAGPLNFSDSVTFPSGVPGGAYTIKLSANDQAGNELLCISVTANIGASHMPRPTVTEDEEQLMEAANVPVQYTNCGAAGDEETVSAVTANVWPPVLGQNFTFQVSGTLKEEITSGIYNTVVNFDFAPAVNSNSSLTDFGVKFPVEAGELDLTMTMNLGGNTPSGAYEVILKPYDQNGNELFCIDMSFNI